VGGDCFLDTGVIKDVMMAYSRRPSGVHSILTPALAG
jgi:hypothetical protein